MTPEQFLENPRTWKPSADTGEKVSAKLKRFRVPPEMAIDLGGSFYQCSQSAYDYVQFVNELASFKVIDRKLILPLVAQLGVLVGSLRDSAKLYQNAFRRYDDFARPHLQKDHFDTVYYDTIQGVEIRDLLKQVIDEVDVVLKSLTLVSAELSGVPCVDLYEGSIRLQLFLRYFMMKEEFSDEELWSVLFDIFNQATEMEVEGEELTAEELEKLQERIKKYKTN